jgi:hypothetical protein
VTSAADLNALMEKTLGKRLGAAAEGQASVIARRLTQLEVVLPDSHPSYDAVEALSLEVRSLRQAAMEGRLTGEAFDARTQDVSDRLQAIAKKAPEVAGLLNLGDDMLDRLATSRATDLLTAGQSAAARGAGGPVPADLEAQGYKLVANRPPAAVSPTERGVTRGRLKPRMITAGDAPEWARNDPGTVESASRDSSRAGKPSGPGPAARPWRLGPQRSRERIPPARKARDPGG